MDIGFVGLHDGRAARRLACAGTDARRRVAALWNADAFPLHDVAPPVVAVGTVNGAMEQGVAAPVLSLALMLAFAAADAPDAHDGIAAMTKESIR